MRESFFGKLTGVAKETKRVGLCWLCYFFIGLTLYLFTKEFMYLMMIWNLFLACLSFLFSIFLLKGLENLKKAKIIIFSVLWLLFFPNAPYMITDMIHICRINYYDRAGGYKYIADIKAWIPLAYIAAGSISAIFLGLISLFIIHRILLKNRKKIEANGAVVIICLVSGYAVYIGRFLRLNSWDILRPMSLLSKLMKNVNWFGMQFSLLIAFLILILYCFSYIVLDSLYQIRKSPFAEIKKTETFQPAQNAQNEQIGGNEQNWRQEGNKNLNEE